MKSLFQTFLSAMVFGLIVYFVYVVYDGNKDRVSWGETNQKLSDEAEKVSEKFDKNVRKVEKIYNKVKDELEEGEPDNTPLQPDGYSGGGADTPPAAPSSQPVNTKQPSGKGDVPVNTTTTSTTRPTSPPQTTGIGSPRSAGNSSDTTTPYDIQLAIIKSSAFHPKNYLSLNDLGTIYTEPASDNRTRVILGSFYGRVRSEQILAIAKQRGFSDAFLILGGKSAPVTPVVNYNTRRLTPNSYMVQLAAMYSPQVKKIKDLSKFGNVYYEYAADRDITKILIGPYETKEEAERAVKTVRLKEYPKAFSRRLTAQDISNLEQIH